MIKITPDALQHLKKKNKTDVIIEYPSHRTSCCGYNVPVPELELKVPSKTKKYRLHEIDGINVHVAVDVIMPEKNDVTIELDSFLGVKSLVLGGFDLKEIMSK